MNARRQLTTIRSSREIDRIFRHGRRAGTPLLSVLVRPTAGPEDPGRVAFIAGRKLGNAVFRNRCRRVLREAVRSLGGPWDGFDVAIIARRETASAPHAEIIAALASSLMRAEVTS